MALWTIEREGDTLTLTWSPSVLPEKLTFQDCGRTSVSLRADLEAWVVSEADPFDIIQTDRGAFVRTNVAGQRVRA